MSVLHLSVSIPNSSLPLYNPSTVPRNSNLSHLSKPRTFDFSVPLVFARSFPIRGGTHAPFCSTNGVSEGFSSTHLSVKSENGSNGEIEELELLGKPSPPLTNNGTVTESNTVTKPSEDEALAPFLKFFKPRGSQEQTEEEGSQDQAEKGGSQEQAEKEGLEEEQGSSEVGKEIVSEKVSVEYYEPRPGDFVVGVVVSGNENKLDVNVGADLLGTMLTKEVLPLYDKEMDYLLCDMDKNALEFMVRGKMGIIKNDDAEQDTSSSGRPVVEIGTVLFAEVLGRTLSGRPLLSSRRLFRRVAWHRVRQVLSFLHCYL